MGIFYMATKTRSVDTIYSRNYFLFMFSWHFMFCAVSIKTPYICTKNFVRGQRTEKQQPAGQPVDDLLVSSTACNWFLPVKKKFNAITRQPLIFFDFVFKVRYHHGLWILKTYASILLYYKPFPLLFTFEVKLCEIALQYISEWTSV